MFSFHKPKVYRSPTGCCICKAKSSSSRFTDSKKYEEDFIECFKLEERRNGEICNACVLLVKRWKKLPTGSNRNWRHVVDARAGPGIKSLTKFKSKNKKKPKENLDKMEKILKKKHVYSKPERYREQSPAMSDDLAEEYLAGAGSKGSSRAGSPAGSDDTTLPDKRLNGQSPPIEQPNDVPVHDWIDLTYFKREIICCGTIFKGPYGEVIIDPTLIKRCLGCTARRRLQREGGGGGGGMDEASRPHSSSSEASASPSHSSASASPCHSVESITSSNESAKPLGKTFSDSSSDSGYDEYSNPGIGESTKISRKMETETGRSNESATKQASVEPVVKSVQLKSIVAVSETVRLKSELPLKLVPMNQVEKLMCKPLSLSIGQAGKVTLSGATSLPIVTSNPLVDFAMHAATRQSVTN